MIDVNALEHLKQTKSLEGLVRLGLEDTAYVKSISVQGKLFFVICAADGTPLMVAPERELAFAAVRQNDMEPASVH